MASSLILELEMGSIVALLLLTLACAVRRDVSSSLLCALIFKQQSQELNHL
jgi:hypothetical protein